MLISVDDFTNKLREYIGTPFRHGGRLKIGTAGAGVDCGGLIMCALAEFGVEIPDPKYYPQGDSIVQMLGTLSSLCDKCDSPYEPGNILLLRSRTINHHIVYFTPEKTIIHAWRSSGISKVVESPFIDEWKNSVHSVWKLRELEQWQH